MKQLSGLDASFLYMETAAQFGHVSSLSVYQRPDDPGYEPLSSWRHQIERRLHLLEPLRRRLRDVPFNLDHPYWVDDPGFDIDFHVRHTAVAPPGSDEQMGELVARIVGRPLDRRRPLWESYVIEGLPDERFAILTKVHHATIDGAAGAELLVLMLDGDPEGDEIEPPADAWHAQPLPSDGEVLTRTAANLLRKPGRAVLLATRTVRELGRTTRSPVVVSAANQVRDGLRGPLGAVLNVGRTRSPEGEAVGPLPTSAAPRTPFNAAITAHRRFAFRSTSLTQVKDIKNALGATVNDVVMAACAGGLRTWLEAHDALPDGPLVAMVPVSIRTGDETEKWTNRVSSIFAALPTDEPDPLQRVRARARGDGRRQGAVRRGAGRRPDRLRPVPAAGRLRKGDAHRHPPQHPLRLAGERGDLQRARSPCAALHGGRPAPALLPGVHHRRRPGPEHHRPELSGHARLRPRRLP